MFDCPACESHLHIEYRQLPDDRFDDVPGDRFDVFSCHNCGLLATDTTGVNLADYYPEGYRAHNTKEYVRKGIIDRIHDWYLATSEQFMEPDIVEIVESNLATGRVLDVGCGDGSLLGELQSRKYDVSGCDVSENAVSAVRDRFKFDVRRGELHELGYEPDSFDAIVFNHSFEHVDKPHEYLSVVDRILNEGGIVVVNIPNADSLERLVFGPRWTDLDVPRHVYNWTPTALDAIFETYGFGRISIEFSSLPRIASDSLNRILRRQLGVSSPSPVIFDPFFVPLSVVGKRVGQSGRFCAVYS